MLATKYKYTIDVEGDEVVIVLTQLETGKFKTFRQVAVPFDRLKNHMDLLTDDCCDSFWPQRNKKKGKQNGSPVAQGQLPSNQEAGTEQAA